MEVNHGSILCFLTTPSLKTNVTHVNCVYQMVHLISTRSLKELFSFHSFTAKLKKVHGKISKPTDDSKQVTKC